MPYTTIDTVNANLLQTKYEVRGEIYLAATKRAAEGKEVIYLNVGNPHALGQKPVTFNRQVLSLMMAPFLLEDPNVTTLFPQDAINRAKLYLEKFNGGLGAYSDSRGNPYVRKEISEYIQRTTGGVSDPDTIFISNGASECVRMLLQTIIRGKTDGILVPIPQYPLYSASIALYGGELVPYKLNEDEDWSIDIPSIIASIHESVAKGIKIRALVFINPGNPTGNCLKEEDLVELITLCYNHQIILIADEVYQENIYNMNKKFISTRKLLNTHHNISSTIRNNLELVTLHTVSKGFYGECGLRGGYMELLNFDPLVINEVYKLGSINLSPNVTGQAALGLMVNPYHLMNESREKFENEKKSIIESLKRRANLVSTLFNSIYGITCQETSGAMYSFPRIHLPLKAIEEAKKRGKHPDVFYCLELLNETGLSCVPGSGFQQEDGTFHFRTTILVSYFV